MTNHILEISRPRPAQAPTVRGPVAVDDLGTALIDEHVFVLSEEPRRSVPENWDEQQRTDNAVTRLTAPATITMWLCGSSWPAATSAVRRPRGALGTGMRAPAVPGFAPSRAPLFQPVVWRSERR
ncbi:hypothetical protein [Streptomyces sp. NPDC090798]|uniref:hypothetical protein n=1 Tax=Streptomyces sp. NPDC090798 TaxID=3365968 RepID=UPI00382CF14C